MNASRPAIAFPVHDPDGTVLALLQTVTPQLQDIFENAFLALSSATAQAQADKVESLRQQNFFHVRISALNLPVGEHFLSIYRDATEHCALQQMLHLCFPDRVAFALQTNYKDQFIADIQAIDSTGTPWLFQRSEKAWRTHPRNYYEIEQMATRAGEFIFNQKLDWTWCHLAIQAQQLQTILPRIHSNDMVVLSEILFHLRDTITTQDVDWLAWEDPHVLQRNADKLRRERENSIAENRKRLSYIIPCMQFLYEASSRGEAI